MARRHVVAAACGLALLGCAVATVRPSVTTLVTSAAPAPQVAQATGPEPGDQPETGPEPAVSGAVLQAVPSGPVHRDIHGLYMTGWIAGSDRFYELVDYLQRSGLNAVVIDVQDDDGYISWETEIPLARAIAAHERKIPDIEARLRYLKERGIYTIARIVVYADPLLGRKRPDMAIQKGQFVDTRGIRWPDPYNREVWDYKVAIAREAVARGFEEIQFDYIRFPEHRISGYNAGVPVRQRTAAIEGFLAYAVEQLRPLGVFVSADVFGLTTSVDAGDDMEIGQDYAAIAGTVDYILPMVYPSHYARGTYGIADPNAQPGQIVYESLVAAQKRTPNLDLRVHRPWIQDFTYGKKYTAADIEEQIRGLARAGIYQWILWDPSNLYTRGVNYQAGGGLTGPPGAWRAAWAAERAAREQSAATTHTLTE